MTVCIFVNALDCVSVWVCMCLCMRMTYVHVCVQINLCVHMKLFCASVYICANEFVCAYMALFVHVYVCAYDIVCASVCVCTLTWNYLLWVYCAFYQFHCHFHPEYLDTSQVHQSMKKADQTIMTRMCDNAYKAAGELK